MEHHVRVKRCGRQCCRRGEVHPSENTAPGTEAVFSSGVLQADPYAGRPFP
jgi:hypothetical protein